MAKRFRARVQATRHLFIHNDLNDAAFHFRGEIQTKLSATSDTPIFYDCIACATMIAFAFEAYLNFFGEKLVNPWNERQGLPKKILQVFTALNLSPDWTARPFRGMKGMKELRDTLAHGKPE